MVLKTYGTSWKGPAHAKPRARVAAGAVAVRMLEEFDVTLHSHVISIAGVFAEPTDGAIDWDSVEESPVRCADPKASALMMAEIDAAKEAGDTVGGDG